jgi:hypothetical protein
VPLGRETHALVGDGLLQGLLPRRPLVVCEISDREPCPEL